MSPALTGYPRRHARQEDPSSVDGTPRQRTIRHLDGTPGTPSELDNAHRGNPRVSHPRAETVKLAGTTRV